MNIILLTKDNCPQCDRLKMALTRNPKTRDIFTKIKTVHEVDNTEEYWEIVKKFAIQSMPALIVDNEYVTPNQILPVLMKAKF